MKKIYLAGRIDGLSRDEAMNWRELTKKTLDDCECLSPLYGDKLEDYTWKLNYFLLDKSDIILANFDYDNNVPFIGTSIEIGRAFYQQKPIIIFSSKEWVLNNQTLREHATIVNSLEEAIDIIRQF